MDGDSLKKREKIGSWWSDQQLIKNNSCKVFNHGVFMESFGGHPGNPLLNIKKINHPWDFYVVMSLKLLKNYRM